MESQVLVNHVAGERATEIRLHRDSNNFHCITDDSSLCWFEVLQMEKAATLSMEAPVPLVGNGVQVFLGPVNSRYGRRCFILRDPHCVVVVDAEKNGILRARRNQRV